jgi:selenocysteine lyase/cysteine desulfurase
LENNPGIAQVLQHAQAAFADWLGGVPGEIVMGPSMTSLAWQTAQVLAPHWRCGDNIVLTQQDHLANTEAWCLAADARDIDVRWVRVDSDGSLDLTDLARKVTRRTRLVSFTAASNVIGTINNVPNIVSMIRASGALVFVDAVHFAAHQLCNVAQWDCDFLACSAYKFYGPRTAALWIRKSVRDSLNGHANAEVFGTSLPQGNPELMSSTILTGFQAAIDYLAGKAEGSSRRQKLERTAAAFATHEGQLISRLWEGLSRIPRIRVLGLPPTAERTATAAFSLKGVAASHLCELLYHRGLRLGCGHFNAAPLVEALGYGATGVVRAGCMMYSTPDEVDRLLSAVAEFAKKSY